MIDKLFMWFTNLERNDLAAGEMRKFLRGTAAAIIGLVLLFLLLPTLLRSDDQHPVLIEDPPQSRDE